MHLSKWATILLHIHTVLSSAFSSCQQDVKAGNVLLTDRGVGKLADVGTSRLQTHTFLSELPLVGTFAW